MCMYTVHTHRGRLVSCEKGGHHDNVCWHTHLCMVLDISTEGIQLYSLVLLMLLLVGSVNFTWW